MNRSLATTTVITATGIKTVTVARAAHTETPAPAPLIPTNLGNCDDCGEELTALLHNTDCVFCEVCEYS